MGLPRFSRASRAFALPWIAFLGLLISSEAHAPQPHIVEAIVTYLVFTIPVWILFEVLDRLMAKESSPHLDGAPPRE